MKPIVFYQKVLLLFVLIPALTFMYSCSDDNSSVEAETDPNLLEVVQTDPNFSTLAGIIEDLGLENTVSNDQLTIFAPTNAAFEAISDVIPNLTNEDITAIVQYHLTQGTILSSDLAATQDVEMLQGEVTLIEVVDGNVVVNGDVNVVEPNVTATNGVIHGIDQVLLPTQYRVQLEGPSIVEVAQDAGNFTTLLELVDIAGLTTTLRFKGPFTVFPPTDEAFTELGQQVDLGAVASDPELVTNILLYHTIPAEVLSTDLSAQQSVSSVSEEHLYITAGEEGVAVNRSANVTSADISAPTNGVLHVVDQVLLPNSLQTIAGIVSKNYNLETLLGLVADRPDILNLLSSTEGEYTLFAPTNEAIENALAAFPGLTDEQITEILTYHVLGAKVLSSDLSDGQTAETLQGEQIEVSVTDDGVQINSANVVNADLEGLNGVVHIIDQVIVPPSYTE